MPFAAYTRLTRKMLCTHKQVGASLDQGSLILLQRSIGETQNDVFEDLIGEAAGRPYACKGERVATHAPLLLTAAVMKEY